MLLRYDPSLITRLMLMLYAFMQEYGDESKHRRLTHYTPRVFPLEPQPIEGVHILGVDYRYDDDWVLQCGPLKCGPSRSG